MNGEPLDPVDQTSWMGIVRRYWYVFSIIVVLTLVAAALVPQLVDPVYQAERAVLLVRGSATPPAAAPGVTVPGVTVLGENPFLASAGGLTTVANAVQVAISGREVRERAAAEGHVSTYEVDAVRGEPILNLSAEGGDPVQVLGTLAYLLEEVDERLQSLQVEGGVEEADTLIRTQPLGDEPIAVANYKDRSRIRLFTLAAGAGVFLVALYVLATRTPIDGSGS
jgi:hypothetical protein